MRSLRRDKPDTGPGQDREPPACDQRLGPGLQRHGLRAAEELLERLAEHGLVGSASKLREFAQLL